MYVSTQGFGNGVSGRRLDPARLAAANQRLTAIRKACAAGGGTPDPRMASKCHLGGQVLVFDAKSNTFVPPGTPGAQTVDESGVAEAGLPTWVIVAGAGAIGLGLALMMKRRAAATPNPRKRRRGGRH